MKPIIIHSPSRTDRYNHLQEQLAGQGINEYEIFPAIVHDNPITGCTHSHKAVILEAIKRGLKNVLVFEDDITFTSPNSWAYFLKGMAQLPPNWDMYMGGIYYQVGIRQVTPLLKQVDRFSSTHCILYNESVYPYVLKAPDNLHIDLWMSKPDHYTKYVCWPLPTTQWAGYSDLVGKEVDYSDMLRDRQLITYQG